MQLHDCAGLVLTISSSEITTFLLFCYRQCRQFRHLFAILDAYNFLKQHLDILCVAVPLEDVKENHEMAI